MYKSGIDLDSTLGFEVLDERGKSVPKRTYPHEELRGDFATSGLEKLLRSTSRLVRYTRCGTVK